MHVHTPFNVHREMIAQVARDYSANIGPVNDMTFSDIRYWYDALRPELRAATKPTKR